MGVAKQSRARVVAGWVCLVAALALYAPLGAAALLAHGMACCTDDHCPIKQHHHPKKQAHHSSMDCDHDMGEMMNCSMACCDDSEKPVVTAVAFVLPGAQGVVSSGPSVEWIEIQQEIAIFRSVVPLSPPPQTSAL